MVDAQPAGDHHRAARAGGLPAAAATADERELHSGLYGGAAANAVDDLHRVLAAVIGLPRPIRRRHRRRSRAEERAGWAELPSGARAAGRGRRAGRATPAPPAKPTSASGRGRRSRCTRSAPAIRPCTRPRISVEARASLSLRLAPGQDARADVRAAAAAAAARACPAHAELELEPWPTARPAWSTPTGRCCRPPSARSSAQPACAPWRSAAAARSRSARPSSPAGSPPSCGLRHGRGQHPLAQ